MPFKPPSGSRLHKRVTKFPGEKDGIRGLGTWISQRVGSTWDYAEEVKTDGS